jgi:hypothetical protein
LKELPVSWKPYGSELFRCEAFQEYHKRIQQWGTQYGIPIIPTVLPKYNDRAVRGASDHYAYPPVSKAPFLDLQDARDAKLFVNNIKAILPYIDSSINMMNINSWNEWFEDTAIEPVGFFPDGPYPDYFNQGDNVGSSTTLGQDMQVPDKVVVYGLTGHKWIETTEKLRKEGIDLTQGFAWPCYGFDYLSALKRFFS